MNISREKLLEEAAVTGFRAEMLEKVIKLLGLLEGFHNHPALKGRLALKGGTALNLFIFDLPRLSIDIDLNYIGAVELSEMKAERPKIEQAIIAVCKRDGFNIRRTLKEHAGGKWQLNFQSELGQNSNLEVDVNFLLRAPLWTPVKMDSKLIGDFKVSNVNVLDIHELTAGKIVALLARKASRDLFDVHKILTTEKLNQEKLRLAFVVYAGINRVDFRRVSVEDVDFKLSELKNQLMPVLRADMALSPKDFTKWVEKIIEECRHRLEIVLPYKDNELEFLNRLLDKGEIVPDLLTDDEGLAEIIRFHSGLKWKALNVCKYSERLNP